jgi:hypothetical protein
MFEAMEKLYDVCKSSRYATLSASIFRQAGVSFNWREDERPQQHAFPEA